MDPAADRGMGCKGDYLSLLLRLYYPLHFFALFRAHELYSVEPYVDLLHEPILDLGCGDGAIADLLFGCPLDYGIDPDEKAIDQAKHNGYYRSVFCGDAHAIPLEDCSLGGIFSNCVLEHIPDMPGLIAEVSRVLKPGACFVATCLSPYYYDLNPAFRMFDKPGMRRFRARMVEAENRLHNHVSVFGREEYARMFEQHGMTLEAHKYYASGPIADFCCKWDTASKYLLPFPALLTHIGVLIYYLSLRHALIPDKEKTIGKWHREFHQICYDRNERNEIGAGQILVVRKKGG